MRKLAIMAALATTALATPAVARDHSWYVGVDAGAMIVEDTKLDFSNDLGSDVNDAIILDYDLGYDIGLNGGYDFGGFRLEGETSLQACRDP
jgi:opacity protein-like surface antigen